MCVLDLLSVTKIRMCIITDHLWYGIHTFFYIEYCLLTIPDGHYHLKTYEFNTLDLMSCSTLLGLLPLWLHGVNQNYTIIFDDWNHTALLHLSPELICSGTYISFCHAQQGWWSITPRWSARHQDLPDIKYWWFMQSYKMSFLSKSIVIVCLSSFLWKCIEQDNFQNMHSKTKMTTLCNCWHVQNNQRLACIIFMNES